jgi:uncharacterized protein YpmS
MIKIIVNIIVIVLVIILLRVLTSCEARSGHMHQATKPTIATQVESITKPKHKLVYTYYITHIKSRDKIKVYVYDDDITSYEYPIDKFKIK